MESSGNVDDAVEVVEVIDVVVDASAIVAVVVVVSSGGSVAGIAWRSKDFDRSSLPPNEKTASISMSGLSPCSSISSGS